MKTLEQRLREPLEDLAKRIGEPRTKGHAIENINEMDQYELLCAISEALEEMFEELAGEQDE